MRRTIISVTVLAAALVLFAGASATGATKTVEVGDDYFSPTPMKIRENTTLDFKWVGEGDHNVYRQSGPGRLFDSGVQNEPGVNFSHKFRKRGTYVLACTLHEKMLMDLKVTRRR